MKAITAKRLREWLANVPDDALLVQPASDHSYRPVSVAKATALFHKDGSISEDFGEDSTPEAEYGQRRNILVIS
jgi:hypothetical protein